MMKNKTLIFLGIIIAFIVSPLISAYSYGGWGGFSGSSPLYYLENPWVMFFIYFLFFVAIIFYTTNKSFKNPTISMVIAAALSLFISIALAQRGWLDRQIGGELGAWALMIAALIAIGFGIKFSFETFGRVGSVAAILITWYVLFSFRDNPEQILPAELLTETFMNVYGFITSFIGLFILLIISAIIITVRSRRKWSGANDLMDSIFGGR